MTLRLQRPPEAWIFATASMKVLLWTTVSTLWAMSAIAQPEDLSNIRRLASLGRTAAAMQQIERFLERNPENEAARLLEGVFLVENGDRAAAKKVFDGLLLDHPDAPDVLNNLAVLYASDNDPERAIQILEQAITSHEVYGTVFQNLRRVYESLASEAYRQALRPLGAAPEPPVVGLELVRIWSSPSVMAEDAEEVVDLLPSAGIGAPVLAEPVPATITQSVEGRDEAVLRALGAWAQAWSEQDVEAYLATYARRFTPADGSSRDVWARQRRQRLVAPTRIAVSIEQVRISEREGLVEARFRQSYRSDRFSDSVTKVLSFVREDGAWRIASEVSLR